MAIPHPPVFMRGDIYRKYGFDTEYRWGADRDLLLKIYLQGYEFRYINQNIANYCAGGHSKGHPQRHAFEIAMISLKYANRPGLIFRIGWRFLWTFTVQLRMMRPAVRMGSGLVKAFKARRHKSHGSS